MPRAHIHLGLCVSAILVGTSCTRSTQEDFWQAGSSYDVHFKVAERGPRLPELPRPTADSLYGRLAVDSVRRDSIFGWYIGRLDSLGVPISEQGRNSEPIGGRVQADSFKIVLGVNVVDGELTMQGTQRGGIASGTWRRPAPPSASGTFEIRRIAK
jgi:hypothetical protein